MVGHTLAAAAILMGIAPRTGRWVSSPTRAFLVSAAVVFTVLVALSRVVLGVHWFSDVFVGLALGWGWVAVSSRLAKRLTFASFN